MGSKVGHHLQLLETGNIPVVHHLQMTQDETGVELVTQLSFYFFIGIELHPDGATADDMDVQIDLFPMQVATKLNTGLGLMAI